MTWWLAVFSWLGTGSESWWHEVGQLSSALLLGEPFPAALLLNLFSLLAPMPFRSAPGAYCRRSAELRHPLSAAEIWMSSSLLLTCSRSNPARERLPKAALHRGKIPTLLHAAKLSGLRINEEITDKELPGWLWGWCLS